MKSACMKREHSRGDSLGFDLVGSHTHHSGKLGDATRDTRRGRPPEEAFK